jgi:hypothetical protein
VCFRVKSLSPKQVKRTLIALMSSDSLVSAPSCNKVMKDCSSLVVLIIESSLYAIVCCAAPGVEECKARKCL